MQSLPSPLSPDPGLLRMLAQRLISSWQAGEVADLRGLVRGVPQTMRLTYLHELIKIDMEQRYQRKQPTMLEDYLARFPELGPANTLPAEVIFAEFRVRRLYGDDPTPVSYRDRFPAQFPQFHRLIGQEVFGTLKPESEASEVPPQPPEPTSTRPSTAGPAPSLPPLSDTPRTILTAPEVPPPVPPTVLPQEGKTLPVLGGYKLLEVLGRGQSGQVYRALAPGHVEVAVKEIFRPLSHEHAAREKQALELVKSLRHLFLLQTQAYWAEQQQLYIVMELADGSLYDWDSDCKKRGLPGIPRDQLLTYFAEAAEALDYLHANNVIHRDVKPGNLLHVQGHAKVADFGLARLFEGRQDGQMMATFCGTPRYMAPEIWNSRVSAHSDQYSLALAFVDMCYEPNTTGRNNLDAIRQQHLLGEFDLSGFTPAEQAVLRKALSKNPEQRFPSCREFVRTLIEASPVSQRRTTGQKPTWTAWAQTITLLLATALATGLLVWVALKFVVRDTPEKPAPAIGLPDGYEPPEGWTGTGLPKVVTYTGLAGQRIEFVRVRREPTETQAPPTFYITRDKVTVGQYLAALKDPRIQRLLAEHGKEYPNTTPGRSYPPAVMAAIAGLGATPSGPLQMLPSLARWTSEVPPLGLPDGRLLSVLAALNASAPPQWADRPVVDVTPVEAYCFALHIKGLLPTVEQWNRAGGASYWDEVKKGAIEKPGPFANEQWKGQATRESDDLGSLILAGPAPEDVSVFGCRGMALYGRELTLTYELLGGTRLAFPRDINRPVPALIRDPPRVILRGGQFGASEPYLFAIGKEFPDGIHARELKNDIGFRVAVEVRDELRAR